MQQVQAVEFTSFVFASNDDIKTTSLLVAEKFGKRHADVLRIIDNIQTQVSDLFYKRNFALIESSTVLAASGGIRKDRAFEITKDGFMFLVMGFTGKAAAQIKEAYIDAFNMMYGKLFPKSYGLKELPPSPYITNKEAQLLSKAISSSSDRSQISKLYRKLYDGYGITEYKRLPSGKLDEALAFLGLRKPESKEMMLIAVEDFEKLRDKKPEMDYQQFIGHINTLENCNMRLVDKRSLEILKYFLDDLLGEK